jgi:hypothetical protein
MDEVGPMVPRNILLLTATITPPKNAADLARTDATLRLRDYEDAIDHHLRELAHGAVDRLVFTENSASDVSTLVEKVARAGLRDKVEFIVYDGLRYPPEYGRGYGEMRLVDHTMQHSRIITSAEAQHALIWKVTGRYVVRNLKAIVKRRPAGVDLYCNMRNYPRRWVDMQLMAWTRHGYDTFLRGVADRIRVGLPETPSGTSPEHLLRGVFEQPRLGARLAPRFNVTPIIDGTRGYDNRSYADVNRWKNRVRQASLKVAPWLWI